jgi:MFS family permease
MATLSLGRFIIPCLTGTLTNVATWFMAKSFGGPRRTLLICGAFLLLAMQLAPLNQTAAGFIATYIVLVAISVACLVAPGLAVASVWWTNPATGPGITEFGTSVGTAAFPPIIAGLLAATGGDWRETMRIVGAFGAVLMLAALAIRYPTDEEKGLSAGASTDAPAIQEQQQSGAASSPPQRRILPLLKRKRFLVLLGLQMFFGIAYFASTYMMVPLARSFGTRSANNTIGTDRYASDEYEPISLPAASALLTINGLVSGVACFVCAALTDKFARPRTIFIVNSFLGAISLALIVVATKYWHLAALNVVLGVALSSGMAIIPAFVVEAYVKRYGAAVMSQLMSASFIGFGVAGGVSGPILADIAEARGSFNVPFVITALSLFADGLLAWCFLSGTDVESAADSSDDDGDDDRSSVKSQLATQNSLP